MAAGRMATEGNRPRVATRIETPAATFWPAIFADGRRAADAMQQSWAARAEIAVMRMLAVAANGGRTATDMRPRLAARTDSPAAVFIPATAWQPAPTRPLPCLFLPFLQTSAWQPKACGKRLTACVGTPAAMLMPATTAEERIANEGMRPGLAARADAAAAEVMPAICAAERAAANGLPPRLAVRC